MVIVANDQKEAVDFERKGDLARIFLQSSNQTVGWNLFNASEHLADLAGNGQILLTEAQLAKMNQLLADSGFSEQLTADNQPKIVIGYVESLEPHPDSDHLNIAQVAIGEAVLQIVAGAPNIEQGQKVVVCRDGAMLPNGTLIFAGELRGIKSEGMLAAARELSLPNAPQKRGILVLPAELEVGIPFDAKAHWHTI
nr:MULTISPECIES: DUF4479 and tRNA-binding domain-containing protein [unclassified Enterococcus]